MKIVIVLPTYNEAENVVPLFHALQSEFEKIPHEICVLVVDDHSEDGTAKLVEIERQKYPNLYLLMGEKEGLGAAYIRGIEYAIEQLGAEVIMQMDADFSHKSSDLESHEFSPTP
jgi:dolichol-phosphate mannosyltransferase